MTRRPQVVNVPNMNEGEDEAIDCERRSLLKGAFAVLALQCLPVAHASGKLPDDHQEAVEDLIIHSSPGLFSHVHDLVVPVAVLRMPPIQGVELRSTRALFHEHNILLTQEQLIAVNQGGTVTQKASSHLFVIGLAKRPDHVQRKSRLVIP